MAATATWDDVFGEVTAGVAEIAAALRGVIRAVDPETVEVAYPGYASVSYGIGPRKIKDGYAYLGAQKDRVNFGFYHGADLDDPEGLLEGTGDSLRHVKVRYVQLAARPAVRALVEAAVAERRMTAEGRE